MSNSGELFGITIQKGDSIFRQGDAGDTMYIIQSGAVEISQSDNGNKTVLAILEQGEFFGEMALIDKHPRSATATAISKSSLLPFTRQTLVEKIRTDPGVIIHLLKTLCNRINNTNRLLNGMLETDEYLRLFLGGRLPAHDEPNRVASEDNTRLHNRFNQSLRAETDTGTLQPVMDFSLSNESLVKYFDGEYIFREGDPGDSMFIILKGGVRICTGSENEKHVLANLLPGEFLGEMAIITDHPRSADAIAVNDTMLFPIRKEEFSVKIKAEPELALYILDGLILRLRAMLSVIADPYKSPSSLLKSFAPPLRKKSLVKTAIVSLSTCGGCSAAILENQENLMKLLDNINISYCPMLIDEEEIKDAEVALVDGLVRVKEDEEKLIEARQKSKYLVAWGTCAAFGGIPAQANHYELEELLEESYGHTKDSFSYYLSGSSGVNDMSYQQQEEELRLLRRARKLDDFVRVDYYLPGCPPSVPLLLNLIAEMKGVAVEAKPKPIVCAECSRKHQKIPVDYFWVSPRPDWEMNQCFTSRGSVCLGFMTKGGCGAVCPEGGLPCWGCRGPSETAFKKMDEGSSFDDFMVNSLISRHKGLEEQIRSVARIFRKHANSALKFNRYLTNNMIRIR